MIAVLGHVNDHQKQLSVIAKSRCDTAIRLWQKERDQIILTTGTFGESYNVTERPHYIYLQEYLKSNGIPPECLSEGIFSTNTYEDILGIRKKCIDHGESSVTIVTSDFHLERTAFICGRILQNIDYQIVEAQTSAEEMGFWREKERNSFELSKNEVFYFPMYSSPNSEMPKEIYENAAQEHKHYDNVSIVAITGQITVYAIGLKYLAELSEKHHGLNLQVLLIGLVTLAFTFLLWKLYHRAAKTAGTARKLLRTLEISYGKYGFSSQFEKYKFAKAYFGTVRIVNWLFLVQLVSLLAALIYSLF